MLRRYVHSPFLVIALLAAVAPTAGQVDATAVIAAWNLKGFAPIEEARIPRLARAIADIDAEVVALCEVNPTSVVDKLVLELSRIGAGYQGTVLDQTAIQKIAILYKAGVYVSNVELVAGSDDNNTGLRKALTADVRVGNFDFKMIVLHLKAGRGQADRNTRTRQATVLAQFIQQAMSGSEKDVLVVGDYNMIPIQDAVNFTAMNPDAFLRFVSSEDLAGQFTHISNGNPGNLLDGYTISQDHTREYIEGTLQIVQLPRYFGITLAQYEADYSDHLPVSARFRVTVDDD